MCAILPIVGCRYHALGFRNFSTSYGIAELVCFIIKKYGARYHTATGI